MTLTLTLILALILSRTLSRTLSRALSRTLALAVAKPSPRPSRSKAAIPEEEHAGGFIAAYGRRLRGELGQEAQLAAAKAWSVWEGSVSRLKVHGATHGPRPNPIALGLSP